MLTKSKNWLNTNNHLLLVSIICTTFYLTSAQALIDKYPGDDGGSIWGFFICLGFGIIVIIGESLHKKKVDKAMAKEDPSKSLREAHPEIAEQWDSTANKYYTPDTVKVTSTMIFTWKCSHCGRTHVSTISEKIVDPRCPWCKKL